MNAKFHSIGVLPTSYVIGRIQYKDEFDALAVQEQLVPLEGRGAPSKFVVVGAAPFGGHLGHDRWEALTYFALQLAACASIVLCFL